MVGRRALSGRGARTADSARVPDSWFLVDDAGVEGDRLRLDAEESRHLLRVFRASPGTRFEATDGRGVLYRCVLERAEGGSAVGRVESRVADAGELPFGIQLLVGLPDPAQAESIVEHAVALGAVRIAFVATARAGPERLTLARMARLERVAVSALKQSRRSRLPKIEAAEELGQALGSLEPAAWRLLAQPGGRPDLPALSPKPKVLIQLAVGPPGGFLDEEVQQLEQSEFAPITLGPNRLTTSTASISLLAWVRNSLLSKSLQ